MAAYNRAALAADARDPSSSPRPRRAPAMPGYDRAADARDPSSTPRPCRAPAPPSMAAYDGAALVADPRDPSSARRPYRAPAAGKQCGARRENDTTGDTRPPPNPVDLVVSGEPCGVRREQDVARDAHPPPNPASETTSQQCGAGDTDLPPNTTSSHAFPQVTVSDAGSEICYIDPECIYRLYINNHLDTLLYYLKSLPGSANDFNCKVIMELINISTSGHTPEDIPEEVKVDWHRTRAEYARDLATQCSISKGSSSFEHLVETFTPLKASSSSVPGSSAGSCEPAPSMSIPHAVVENCNEGHIVQNIPLGSRYWDTRRSLLPNVEGINPLRFYGHHPVWEEHAVPVEKDKNAKVEAFYCTYCKKVFIGNANAAGRHLTGGSCKIPPDLSFTLMDEIDDYLARRSEIHSNAKGRKLATATRGLKILQKCTSRKIMNLMMDLSRNGDDIGDGIWGVLVMARSLLNQAEIHLIDGVDSIKIVQGFETASKMASDQLKHIAQNFEFDPVRREPMIHSCMTALSTIDHSHKKVLAQIVVEAILSIADTESMNVNLDLVKVHGKIGGKIEHTELVNGIVLEKEMSHPRMPKQIDGAKIALLACSFESSSLKAKENNLVDLDTIDEPMMLHEQQKAYLIEMVKKCQSVGATLIICQWDFDEEANDLLMHSNLPAVRGVSTLELESIAIATGGRIVPRFQDLSPNKLGNAESVREKKFGRSKIRMLYVEKCANLRPVTILLHGGTKRIIENTKRSIADALCVTRNLMLTKSVVCGSGSAELSCSIVVEGASNGHSGAEKKIIRSFAHVLDSIPLSLAENIGLPPIETLARVKSRHVKENNPYLGIDCNALGTEDMQVQQVFASRVSKMHQISLALKLLKLILRDVT